MSIRLKDTIYNKSKDTETLEGYSRSGLFKSIPDWISASNLVEDITVTGFSANFYPVVITVSTSKAFPTYITIVKNLGTTTPSISGNHENGTSSLWLRYEMRNTSWDGNGGYIKTWYRSQSYGTLVSHVETDTKGHGGLIVWLRGGTCSYSIACTNTFSVNVYYSTTNIGSTTYPNEVSPRTDIGNAGILSSVVLGYGNLSGNASTASKLANARTISLTGAVTGSVSFDGSQNVTLETTKNHTHNYTSTIKIGTSATEYKCTDNIITLPAYPTIPTIPTSLKNPYSLTIKGNGIELGKYDGSAAKTIDITYSNVGAAPAEHTHDRVKTVTPSGSAGGWYRIGTISTSNASYSQNVIISLQRSYYSPENEHYIFAISIGYNGYISITQLSGLGAYINKNGRLIEKVRIVWNNSGNCYFDYYMKSGSYNNGYKVTVLAGDFTTLQDIVLVTSAGGSVTEFTTTNGCKSNYGFTGDLTGNATTATTATTASKLAVSRTISLTGAITGSGTFDGSDNLSITTSVNHTHSYAGSSSAGGAATSANKLNTNAGGTTIPVYFTGGIPTACSVASGDATASTIAVRNSSGDIYARLIRQTYEDQETISGGIVYRVNNSTDNYLRVCKSTSAIREYLGVPSSSDLSSYLPRQRMTNPDPGHASVGTIPLILALKSAGTPVYTDPEFKNGVNSCYVYNNSGNSSVTVSHITDNQNSGNSSGKILQISTTTGTASPGRGGFYQTMNSRAGAVFCQIFRAKIPTGFTLANNENSMGSGYKTYWMTNKAGTGKWEWYCRITICGTSGSFSSGGHVSLGSDAGGNVAVTWYLSYCNVIDLTRGHHDGLRAIYSNSSLCADKLGTFKLSDGTVTGTAAGTATNPVYFLGGVPTSCTYSLNKTVPSDAKFTDTTYSSGSGISINGTTINHANTIAEGTIGTSSATSGATLSVPYVTYNSTGHITKTGTHTHTVSGFLPSSGGTITGTLTIKRNASAIKYLDDSDNIWGWLGFSAKNVGTLWESDGSTKHTLLHSGNYTSYAPSLNHSYGYVMKLTTIDASSLNANTYYPVIIPVSPYSKTSIRIEIEVSLNSNKKPAWSTHDSGFSVRKVWETNGSGWGTATISRRVLVSTYGFASTDPVRGIGQLTNSSNEYVYVRGGGLYYFYTSHGVTPSLKTSTYTASSQSVSPTTTAPAAIEESYSYTGHTHNYAGSSSAGGAANNSLKWGGYSISVGSAGSDPNTIYFVV